MSQWIRERSSSLQCRTLLLFIACGQAIILVTMQLTSAFLLDLIILNCEKVSLNKFTIESISIFRNKFVV